MEKELVSLVTPCYNTGKYIHRLLDSVLRQTYPNIEMFVINDGSTDDSLKVARSYVEKFEQRGYSLTVVSQENSGQSVAVREGMKMVNGKYFVWPDSDDYYASEYAIERMVDAFSNLGDDYALVRTQENQLEDETFRVIGCHGLNATNDYDQKQLFEDCLFCQNGFYFCSGAYMADFKKLKKCTTLDIYTDKNAGQNWQLMLPLLFNYKCYTIKEPLYNVVCRLTSHSRGQYVGFDRQMTKIASYEQTSLETLKRVVGLSEADRDNYSSATRNMYCKERMKIAYNYHRKEEFDKFYVEAASKSLLNPHEKLMKCFFNHRFVLKGLSLVKRICNLPYRIIRKMKRILCLFPWIGRP